MLNKDYNIENLWVVHKCVNNIRESFICRDTEKGLVEIFSGSIQNLEKGKYHLTPLSKYYDVLVRMFYAYQDLSNLLNKFNEINDLGFIRFYSSTNTYSKEFKIEKNKWYKYELLKYYNLNKLFIVQKEEDLNMCRYSNLLNSYIDIFTKQRMTGNIILLNDYLNNNNIKCDYKRLNTYSLLRLYQKINIVSKYLNGFTEDIVINELKSKGLYEKSKIYKIKKKLP